MTPHYKPVLHIGDVEPTYVHPSDDMTLYAALVANVYDGSYEAAAYLISDADCVGGAFARRIVSAETMLNRRQTRDTDPGFQGLDEALATHIADVSSRFFNDAGELAARHLLCALETIDSNNRRMIVTNILEILGVVPHEDYILAIRRDERRARAIAKISEMMFPGNVDSTSLGFYRPTDNRSRQRISSVFELMAQESYDKRIPESDIVNPVAVARLIGNGASRSQLRDISHQIFVSIVHHLDW